MARRVAARYVSRRLSSGGKVLSEEEKAAENIYIKKLEKDKLEKKAREGLKSETQATGSGTSATEGVKPSGSEAASAPKTSTDKDRNYAVVAGVVTGLAAFGWYYKSKPKKVEEVQD